MNVSQVLVLDSGIGGLSIAKAIWNLGIINELTYVADHAFFPYGEQPRAKLATILSTLLQQALLVVAPTIIVIACNTASIQALDQLRQQTSIPIVGVVPAIKPAAQMTTTGVIGVLATQNTVASPYLKQLITAFAGHQTVILKGSSRLVTIAEESMVAQKQVAVDVVTQALGQLFSKPQGQYIDVLVLACTHFPVLRHVIETVIPSLTSRPVAVIDSGEAVARQVHRILQTPETIQALDFKFSMLTRIKGFAELQCHPATSHAKRWLLG